jgi:hypothetical protein
MNIIYFITHTTLTERHAKLCCQSLINQSTPFWDEIRIYNTQHQDLPNDYLVNLLEKTQIKTSVMSYNDSSKKTLAQDILNIKNDPNQNASDNCLLLKSEYLLSNNFNEVSARLVSDKPFVWTPPVLNAKEWVQDDHLIKKISSKFCEVDFETYYRGSDISAPHNEYGPCVNGKYLKDTDEKIAFVSHKVRCDYNLHLLNRKAFDYMEIPENNTNSTWGGMWDVFNRMRANVEFLQNDDAFSVHVYHPIISKNRPDDRNDHRKVVAGQKY